MKASGLSYTMHSAGTTVGMAPTLLLLFFQLLAVLYAVCTLHPGVQPFQETVSCCDWNRPLDGLGANALESRVEK